LLITLTEGILQVTKTRQLVLAAVIAAIYAALSAALAPIGFGPIQLRVSEALTVLPYFIPAAVPGLYAGCLIVNFLFSPFLALDITLGALGTLSAAICTYLIGRYVRGKIGLWLSPLPPVILNAVFVGLVLWLSSAGEATPLWIYMLQIGVCQLVPCYVLGLPLLMLLLKYRERLKL
jgi:uncharacterized membrane protein